jgi:hypothetical protein
MEDIKKRVIPLIVLLTINCNELIFDIKLKEDLTFNSIEWLRETNQIILHKFIDEYDYEYNFDELPNKMKKRIFTQLMRIYEST